MIHFIHTTRRNNRSGVAATEFAVVAPVLFMVILAGVEFSRMSMLRHATDNAAYEGARLAIVPGATAAEATAAAQQVLDTHNVVNATISVTPTTIDEDTDKVRVDVSVPMNGNTWFARFGLDRSITTYSELMTERMPVFQAKTFVLPPPEVVPPEEPPLI